MYQVYNTATGEAGPIMSETPYALAGEYTARRMVQKTDEQGNLLYLTTVERTVQPEVELGEEPVSLQLETIDVETTEAYHTYEREVWNEEEQDYVVETDTAPNPPVMVDAGPVYEWREVVPTLDELKLQKRQEINAAKDAAEAASPFWYMEKPFDFDPLSRERLGVAIQLAQSLKIAGVPGTQKVTDWKLYDNTLLELTVDMLCDMPQAFAQKSAELHQKTWGLKEDIDAATTAEQIAEINWE